MDTSLKKNKRNLNKHFFILSVLIGILIFSFMMFRTYGTREGFYSREDVSYYFQNFLSVIDNADEVLEDEDTIKESVIVSFINDYKFQIQSNLDYHKEIIESAELYGHDEDQYSENVKEYDRLEKELNRSDDSFRQDAINELKSIQEEFLKFYKNSNFEFFIEREDENSPLTNIKGSNKVDFKVDMLNNYKDYIIVHGRNSDKNGKIEISRSMEPLEYVGIYPINDYDLYIRVPKEMTKLDILRYEWTDFESSYAIGRTLGGVFIIDFIIILGILIGFIKRDRYEFKENYVIRLYNKLYVEVKLLIFALMIFGIMAFVEYSYNYYYNDTFFISSISVCSMVLLYFFMIDGYQIINKKVDRKNIYSNSMILKLIQLIRDNFIIKSTFARVSILIIGIIIDVILIVSYLIYQFIFSLVLFILITALGIVYILKIGQQVNKLKEATDNIVKGEYNNQISIKGPYVLKEMAKNLYNIESGLESSIERAVRSERMKGELITNVSHDLKTPLTSIINYVDLLSKDDVSDEDREKYIGVLKDKSQRLKILIEDLFEASKASSGSIELDIVELDPVALLRQTIGELEDKILLANLQIVKNIPEDKVLVLADGKKTFRIFQNLLSNIIKYSMKGSRVYIDVVEDEEYVQLMFKNISQYQLNINPDELMERFKRGDSSRTTEGSGLGLSIAKSLVELQGGEFKIEIDGDLFKASVKLRKIKVIK